MIGSRRGRPLPAGARGRERSEKARRRRGVLHDVLGSSVKVLVATLILRVFVLESFAIPTGSMASSLRGAHKTQCCRDCGYEYAYGMRMAPGRASESEVPTAMPRRMRCPLCQHETREGHADYDRAASRQAKRGDQILVLKSPFGLGDWCGPKRWDVVVFKDPQDLGRNLIKRLVGLPGETVEIIDGDVFIDGEIARKSAAAQEALWFPFFDSDYVPQFGVPAGRWERAAGQDDWRGLGGHVFESGEADDDGQTIAYRRRAADGVLLDTAIPDSYAYNGSMGAPVVTDVRIRCVWWLLESDGDGFVELRLGKYGDLFVARFYCRGRIELFRGAIGADDGELAPLMHVRCPTFQPGRLVELSLANADHRVSVGVDGEIVLRTSGDEVGDEDPYCVTPEQLGAIADEDERRVRGRTSSARHVRGAPVIEIGVRRVRAKFLHVRLDRDVYYTSELITGHEAARGVRGRRLALEDDEHFMLGDNSPVSNDSRLWEGVDPSLQSRVDEGRLQLGVVPGDLLIGRAFFVIWPSGYRLLGPEDWTAPERMAPPLRLLLRRVVPNVGRMRLIR